MHASTKAKVISRMFPMQSEQKQDGCT